MNTKNDIPDSSSPQPKETKSKLSLQLEAEIAKGGTRDTPATVDKLTELTVRETVRSEFDQKMTPVGLIALVSGVFLTLFATNFKIFTENNANLSASQTVEKANAEMGKQEDDRKIRFEQEYAKMDGRVRKLLEEIRNSQIKAAKVGEELRFLSKQMESKSQDLNVKNDALAARIKMTENDAFKAKIALESANLISQTATNLTNVNAIVSLVVSNIVSSTILEEIVRENAQEATTKLTKQLAQFEDKIREEQSLVRDIRIGIAMSDNPFEEPKTIRVTFPKALSHPPRPEDIMLSLKSIRYEHPDSSRTKFFHRLSVKNISESGFDIVIDFLGIKSGQYIGQCEIWWLAIERHKGAGQ